jgi:hemoglobin-like flavoprotein
MNSEFVQLVQTSWEKVVPMAEQAAALFYGRLFEIDPELKPLFQSDIREQGAKLMRMITLAVRGLSDPDKLIPALEDLGRRHVDYNVRMKDYDSVGAALLWTLEQGLGEGWTHDVEEAWVAVYTLLADTMKHAAERQIGVIA